MPPKRGVKSTSRKNTPVSPPKPASSAGSPKQARRSTRGPTREGTETDPLQRGSVELSLQPVVEANEEDSIEVVGGPESDSSETSLDIEDQLDTLDPDFIVDSLEDLHRESSSIIGLFDQILDSPDTLTAFAEELDDASSKVGRRFRQQLTKYMVTRQSFGEDLYIHPTIVVRALRNGEAWADIPDGKWRPDAVLYLANIAQLLVLCFLKTEDQQAQNLKDLRNFYPHLFSSVGASSRLRTTLGEVAVKFSNAFRTQLFIKATKQQSGQPDFDPDLLLHELFPEEGPGSGIEIAGDNLSAAVENRLREIRKFVTTNSKNPVKTAQLEKTFPLVDFLTHVVRWAVFRSQELEAQIAAQGGVENIVNCIQDKDFTPLDDDAQLQTATAKAALEQALPIDPQLTQGTASAKKGRGKAPTGPALEKQIAQLKTMRAAKAAREVAAAEKASTPARRGRKAKEIPQSPDLDAAAQPDVTQDGGPPPPDDEDLLRPTQMTAFVERTLAAHDKESEKENIEITRQRSFLDKQTNARKVGFNDTQSPGKRQRAAEVSDDDDEEFEQDQRPSKQARRGRGRPRLEQGQSSTQPTRAPLRDLAISRPPPSSAPAAMQDDDDDLPASQRWVQANTAAKMNTQAHREQNRDTNMQVRRPWSHEEVNRLMELIDLNGPKYSKILQDDKDPEIYPEGPLLQQRSQVQLKDKARNIKLDFLK